MLRGFTVATAVLGLACGAAQPAPSVPDLAVVRTELDSLWSRYRAAILAGDAEAITRIYTASPYLIESGLPTVKTAAALRDLVKEVFGSVRFIESSIQPELTELAGEQVLQFGTYRDVLQPAGQPVQVVLGRFSAVLLRDSTSAWRVSRLVAVADTTFARPPES